MQILSLAMVEIIMPLYPIHIIIMVEVEEVVFMEASKILGLCLLRLKP